MEQILNSENVYSYQDLDQIDDNKRYEIYDGELILMSSPTTKHQLVLGELFVQFSAFFKDKKCTPFLSALDVRLDGKGKRSTNVVQPDLMVVCDKSKIKENGIEGAPDFVLEILSKNNRYNDLVYKMNLYQKFGVKEYWIVDIDAGLITVCKMGKGNLFNLPKSFEIKDKVKSVIFPELEVCLKEIYNNNQNILKEDEETYYNER